MEKNSSVKPSVSKLAQKFQNLQTPDVTEPGKPARIRPPCSLKLPDKKDGERDKEEKQTITASHPEKGKSKNSPRIEQLQAKIILSPMALLPSPKSPGLKLLAPFPGPLCASSSSTSQPQQHHPSEHEVPASFETPVEGPILPSINKGRARHSIKRRPPTRQHRKSSAEEVEAAEICPSSSATSSSLQNGNEEDVFQETDRDEKKGQEDIPSCLPSRSIDKENKDKAEAETLCGSETDEGKEETTELIKADEGIRADGQTSDSSLEAPNMQEKDDEPQPEQSGATDASTVVNVEKDTDDVTTVEKEE